jgi:hypothetical protein
MPDCKLTLTDKRDIVKLLDKREIAEMVADILEERMRLKQIWLTEKEAAMVLSMSPASLRQMRYTGDDGPPYVRMGDGEKAPVRYDRAELHMWAATRPRYTCTRPEYEREEA